MTKSWSSFARCLWHLAPGRAWRNTFRGNYGLFSIDKNINKNKYLRSYHPMKTKAWHTTCVPADTKLIKRLAATLLSLSDNDVRKALATGELLEIKDGK